MKNKLKCCVLMVLSCLIFAGCGEKSSYHTAHYVGYDEITFEDAMNEYVDFMLKSSSEVVDFDTAWEEGWIDSYSSDSFSDDEQALTYSMRITLIGEDGEIEKNKVSFSMIYNKKENELYTVGGYMIEDGDYYSMESIEARGLILEILNSEYEEW